jgi:hypothetical protein
MLLSSVTLLLSDIDEHQSGGYVPLTIELSSVEFEGPRGLPLPTNFSSLKIIAGCPGTT